MGCSCLGGTRVRTDKVSDNANPQFNELLAIPAMMPIQSGAEQYAHYLAWNQMSPGVMDSDIGRDGLIAKRSLARPDGSGGGGGVSPWWHRCGHCQSFS